MSNPSPIVPIALAAILTGCASSLSGIGGSERYACKAPEGALCTSVSGVYSNSLHRAITDAGTPAKSTTSIASSYEATGRAPSQLEGSPNGLRSEPRVLRLWIAPWEDADGDLHEESVVHVVVDNGRWLIEHVRPPVRSRMDRVLPPAGFTNDPAPQKSDDDSEQTPARLPVAPGQFAPGAASSTER